MSDVVLSAAEVDGRMISPEDFAADDDACVWTANEWEIRAGIERAPYSGWTAASERFVMPIGTCTDFGMSTEFGRTATQRAADLMRRNSGIKCVADKGASK
jgi:hypothetical protein